MARTSEQLTNEEIEIVEQLSDVANSNYVYRDMNWDFVGMAGWGGSGDVVWPASAVDNNFASFNLTTGKIIKDSGYNAASFTAANSPITGATKTKITYDAKGLVTAGADATTADISDSTNKRYVTDTDLEVLSKTSGTNTGDNATNTQYSGLAASKEDTIAAGTTSQFWRGDKAWTDFATTVRASVLTGLSLATNQVIAATDTVLQALGYLQAQITAFAAATIALTNKTINLSSNTITGTKAQFDTAVSDGNICFDGDSVTNLNMATARILGRTTASTGAVEEITVGAWLSLSGGTLSASWSSGTKHKITIPWQVVLDANNYQGLYLYNDTGATITITNVDIAVGIAAAGSWAACTVQLYKSSGTAADGLNTNAVALFSSAIALGSANTSLNNVPNTATVESGRWVTLRVTASAGATNFASDLQCIITY